VPSVRAGAKHHWWLLSKIGIMFYTVKEVIRRMYQNNTVLEVSFRATVSGSQFGVPWKSPKGVDYVFNTLNVFQGLSANSCPVSVPDDMVSVLQPKASGFVGKEFVFTCRCEFFKNSARFTLVSMK
jgi:hypothetical protein